MGISIMAKTSVKEFKLVNVELLVPYANNARTHSKEQIKKIQSSLREFGFINPLIIDREHNVLAGHGRLAAAKAEGYKEVPCVFVEDLDGQQIKDYALNSIIDKMGKNIAMCREEEKWAQTKLDLMNGVELITNKQNQGKTGNN